MATYWTQWVVILLWLNFSKTAKINNLYLVVIVSMSNQRYKHLKQEPEYKHSREQIKQRVDAVRKSSQNCGK